MRCNNTIALVLMSGLTACGGGSSGGGEKKPTELWGFGATAPEVQAQIDKIDIDETSPKIMVEIGQPRAEGISWHPTKFVRDSAGFPYIWWRFDNNSSLSVRKIHCGVMAYKDGEHAKTGNLNFGEHVIVNPGESAMEASDFYRPDTSGFAGFDRIWLSSCDYIAEEPSIDDYINGPVKVKFLGFDNFSSKIELSLTNNFPHPITHTRCRYKAKVGNVIVDQVDIGFNWQELIAPGETVVADGRFSGKESVDNFDATFDPANLNCNYSERK